MKQEIELFDRLQPYLSTLGPNSYTRRVLTLAQEISFTPIISFNTYYFTPEYMKECGRTFWPILGRSMFGVSVSDAVDDIADLFDLPLQRVSANQIADAVFDAGPVDVANRYHYRYQSSAATRDWAVASFALTFADFSNVSIGEDPAITEKNILTVLQNSYNVLYSDSKSPSGVSQKQIAIMMAAIQYPESWIHAFEGKGLSDEQSKTLYTLGKIAVMQQINRTFEE